jgi:hypothetical protein
LQEDKIDAFDPYPGSSTAVPYVNTIYDRMRAVPGYWYLATPYSKYPLGREWSAKHSCVVAVHFIMKGIPVFCPIAHSHQISATGLIGPLDHSIWLPADRPLMDGACGLIVCEMDSWQDSYGMAEEIKTFIAADKPIEHFQPYGRALPCKS